MPQGPAQGDTLGVPRHPHRQRVVFTAKPFRATGPGRQHPGDGPGPGRKDPVLQPGFQRSYERVQLVQVGGDQNQALGPGTPLQTQQPPYGSVISGVATQTIDRFRGVGDYPTAPHDLHRPTQTP